MAHAKVLADKQAAKAAAPAQLHTSRSSAAVAGAQGSTGQGGVPVAAAAPAGGGGWLGWLRPAASAAPAGAAPDQQPQPQQPDAMRAGLDAAEWDKLQQMLQDQVCVRVCGGEGDGTFGHGISASLPLVGSSPSILPCFWRSPSHMMTRPSPSPHPFTRALVRVPRFTSITTLRSTLRRRRRTRRARRPTRCACCWW